MHWRDSMRRYVTHAAEYKANAVKFAMRGSELRTAQIAVRIRTAIFGLRGHSAALVGEGRHRMQWRPVKRENVTRWAKLRPPPFRAQRPQRPRARNRGEAGSAQP